MENTYSFPAAIFCIIIYEFCERFSFCGLRTILSLYLRNELLFSENGSTVIYHIFNMACHAVPLLGAFCADSFIGRYKTILHFTIVYLLGNILICIASIPKIAVPRILICTLSLVLLAIGSGGIKPCVAAFGGDQFRLPAQQNMLRNFFSIFYFTINLGGFVGMILTPILRKWISCFGEDTCYALGFGFPTFFMAIGLLVLIMGKVWYRVRTPKEKVLKQFVQCATYALVQRSVKKKLEKKKYRHWLDYAKGKYNAKLIVDMKIVLSILLLYIPLPLFWSLFDQQGSRWTFQASHMDGHVLGLQIVPDQMQVLNPVLVLILIPFFDRIFYPFCDRLDLLQSALHRMAIGGLIAGLAFFAAGILELVLETTYPMLPEPRHSSINIINTLPCELNILNPFNTEMNLKYGEMWTFRDISSENKSSYNIVISAPTECGNVRLSKRKIVASLDAIEDQVYTTLVGVNNNDEIEVYITNPVDLKKSLNGKPRMRVVYIKESYKLTNVTVSIKSNSIGLVDVYFVHDSPRRHLTDSAYMELPQGLFDSSISCRENKRLHEETFHLDIGGVYSLVIRDRGNQIEFIRLYEMATPNQVNILWLLPQYLLISVAEIMFGVAGLEFSFTQAPKSMKTVTIASWYLSVAFGNFLVIVITQANFFKSQANEFFMFAVLIVADMMLFAELASKYKFVTLEADSSIAFLQEPKSRQLMVNLFPVHDITSSGFKK